MAEGLLGFVARLFDPRTEYIRVPVEEITAQRLAQHMLDYPTANNQPFDRSFILNSMGYKPNLNIGTDFMTKYPREYQALNRALRKLTDAGILRQEAAEEPNQDGERDQFWVEDIDKLRELASKPLLSSLPAGQEAV